MSEGNEDGVWPPLSQCDGEPTLVKRNVSSPLLSRVSSFIAVIAQIVLAARYSELGNFALAKVAHYHLLRAAFVLALIAVVTGVASLRESASKWAIVVVLIGFILGQLYGTFFGVIVNP